MSIRMSSQTELISHKETILWNRSMFFLLILLVDGRSMIRSGFGFVHIMKDLDPGGTKTYESTTLVSTVAILWTLEQE
jgi:hypothetical protein